MGVGTIVVVGYNRPELLQRTLVYLSRCHGIENYTVLGYTHGPEHTETFDILRNMRVGGRNHCIVGRDPGPIWSYSRVSVAIKDALNLAFETSDFVVCLEEDILLAPDALRYFEWADGNYMDDPHVFSVTAFGDRNFPPHPPYAARRFNGFCSWAWGTWRNRWSEISRRWDEWEWDRGLRDHIREDRVSIMPLLSRCKNVGEHKGVTNASPHLEEWANNVKLDKYQSFYEVVDTRRDN